MAAGGLALLWLAGCASATVSGAPDDGGPGSRPDGATPGDAAIHEGGKADGPMMGTDADVLPPPPPGPSCTDGLANQGETAVDCGGPCGECNPATYAVRLSDYMDSKFDFTAGGVRYTNENAMSPIYTENYEYCVWNAPDANTCRAQLAAKCPGLQAGQWGCMVKTTATVGGAGWKFGFHTPKPNFRFLSKGGFPEQTLEIFWFDSEWVYALSSTLGNGAKNFMSYTQVSHPAVTYANRGAVWYRNNFTTLRSNAVAGRWEGPTVVLPDNEVLIYKQNKWSEVSTWGPGTPGSEGYAVARFMPRIHGFGNEGGGMLPNVLNVLAIEAGRRDVGHPEIVRFQETYFYAGYGDDKFGLIRFELWSSQPELCVNGGGRYPGIVCNGHMVRDGMVAPNHFKRLPDYTEGAQASATAFFNAAMAARPLNDPKLKKRAILDRNRPAMRGGFQFQGAGSDSFGAAGPGEWILLENTVSDADWYFHPSTQWTCREGYKYLGSLAVKASVDDRGVPTLGDHWIILCGTDDDVRLELTCPAGFSTRAWFPAGLGARTTSGTDVTNAATFMNFCVRNSQCVGACYPSTAP